MAAGVKELIKPLKSHLVKCVSTEPPALSGCDVAVPVCVCVCVLVPVCVSVRF